MRVLTKVPFVSAVSRQNLRKHPFGTKVSCWQHASASRICKQPPLVVALVCVLGTGTCAWADVDVVWALQISDLHLSIYNEHWLPRYGDKEGDLQ